MPSPTPPLGIPRGIFSVIAGLLADHYWQIYRAADGIVQRRLEGP